MDAGIFKRIYEAGRVLGEREFLEIYGNWDVFEGISGAMEVLRERGVGEYGAEVILRALRQGGVEKGVVRGFCDMGYCDWAYVVSREGKVPGDAEYVFYAKLLIIFLDFCKLTEIGRESGLLDYALGMRLALCSRYWLEPMTLTGEEARELISLADALDEEGLAECAGKHGFEEDFREHIIERLFEEVQCLNYGIAEGEGAAINVMPGILFDSGVQARDGRLMMFGVAILEGYREYI